MKNLRPKSKNPYQLPAASFSLPPTLNPDPRALLEGLALKLFVSMVAELLLDAYPGGSLKDRKVQDKHDF